MSDEKTPQEIILELTKRIAELEAERDQYNERLASNYRCIADLHEKLRGWPTKR